MQHHIDKLRYPIGKFVPPLDINRQIIDGWLKILESFPQKLKEEVVDLSEQEVEQSYRPGGWTIRQLVHHCADSHMNSLIRFKLALTEEHPLSSLMRKTCGPNCRIQAKWILCAPSGFWKDFMKDGQS
ncbi:DinB family protein [Sphingobacterium spiritivorum]